MKPPMVGDMGDLGHNSVAGVLHELPPSRSVVLPNPLSEFGRGSSVMIWCGFLGENRGDGLNSSDRGELDFEEYVPSAQSLTRAFLGDSQGCTSLGVFASQELMLEAHPGFVVAISFLFSSVVTVVSSVKMPTGPAVREDLVPAGVSCTVRLVEEGSSVPVEPSPASAFVGPSADGKVGGTLV